MGDFVDGQNVLNGNFSMPSTNIGVDSIHDYFHASVGEPVTTEITLAASGGAESINMFQLTGTVEVVSIHGFVSEATTLANLTGGSLQLWDSTAAIQITKNDGVLSGMGVGTLLVKNAVAANTIAIADNAVGALTEGASLAKAFAPFFITQKLGADTYIRWTYTTSDTPIDAKIFWHIKFRPEAHGAIIGTLVAV
jgi:hypothetical protein